MTQDFKDPLDLLGSHKNRRDQKTSKSKKEIRAQLVTRDCLDCPDLKVHLVLLEVKRGKKETQENREK